MRILITGGNTEIPIDQVRVISNIFKGRTAVAIAKKAVELKHYVTLIGNESMNEHSFFSYDVFIRYRTYDDLAKVLKTEVTSGGYDAIIHSAAVSDYYVSQVLREAPGVVSPEIDRNPSLMPVGTSGKIRSNHDKLYLELKPTEKLIDKIRDPWGFKGILVKFKLQVGMTDEELLRVAISSRVTSGADIIVANCLEWAKERAYIIDNLIPKHVDRKILPDQLLGIIEANRLERSK